MNIIDQMKKRQPVLWINPSLKEIEPNEKVNGYNSVYMQAAQNRFLRFMPYIAEAFPETAARRGVIESPLVPIPKMREWLNSKGAGIIGNLYLKDDARLPIAGSVKARGGIHEVMQIAESLCYKAGKLLPSEDHTRLLSDEFREFFGQYTIQVGSTGNLGISIGRMASRMGFRVIVHMSRDAKGWKKDLLRRDGVIVKEYEGDYSQAVASGRMESASDEKSIFIDDENSRELFFGYSTAAMRLRTQIKRMGIRVDEFHQLFFYLPCGVGGAPAGITFGMKETFLDDAHCFFAEPVNAPAFTLGMASGKGAEICVGDIGLSGETIADGLAVGRPSAFACKMMDSLMSGSFTVPDEKLKEYQEKLMELEGIYLEPSACAGFYAFELMGCPEWKEYLEAHKLTEIMENCSHIVWGTGGGLDPHQ